MATYSSGPSFVGVQMGDYKLERRLGRGPFGEVYAASSIVDSHPAAVKLLHHDPDALRRRVWEQPAFTRLVQGLCGMDHEFVVDAYCFCASEEVCFLAEELLEHRTLRAAMAQGHRLTLDDVMLLAGEILIALDYAHQRDIHHLDLRPENVFLVDERGGIKVTDFSTLRLSAAVCPSRFAHGYRTPYSAPEVADGTGASVRSDVYSFGALMFEMLSGEPLIKVPPPQRSAASRFRHLELGDTQAVPVEAEPEDPQERLERVPGIPKHVVEAVLGCICQKPGDRWEHIRQVRIVLGFIKPAKLEHRRPMFDAPMLSGPPRPAPPRAVEVPQREAVLVKCPSCGRLLPPNGRACLVCGTLAGPAWRQRTDAMLAERPYNERFFLQQGDRLFSEGRFEEAQDAYRSATQANPRDAYAFNCLGDALCVRKAFKAAQQAYEQAVRLDPRDLDAKHDLARVLLTRGRLGEAERLLGEILAAKPPPDLALSAQVHLGAAYAQQGKLDLAAAMWEAALVKDPNSADLCHCIGTLLAHQGNYAAAVEYWNRAIQIDPAYTPARQAMARARPGSPHRLARSPLVQAAPFIGGGLLFNALLNLGCLLGSDQE